MVDSLEWNDGEGYDIHVVHGAPSKPLDQSFDFSTSQFPLAQFPLEFVPHFKGAPSAHGVKVNTSTGVVEVQSSYKTMSPKLRNFLMTARQKDPATNAGVTETLIRIHVHDSIGKIWLTPPTLTIHMGGAPECKFTVLAQFDDDSIGDVTDWTQISWSSANQNNVKVDPATRVLEAQSAGVDAAITATVNLPSPPPPASALAIAIGTWTGLGGQAHLDLVGAPPPANPSNLSTFLKDKANILFIAEGFPGAPQNPGDPPSREADFQQAVQEMVQEIRTIEPFNMLVNSVNFWRLFYPSKQDGVTVLGEYEADSRGPAFDVPRPEQPPTGASSWTVQNMFYKVGLPVPKDPIQGVEDYVKDWNKLYDAQATKDLVTKASTPALAPPFPEWFNLRKRRTILNERDSAFGIVHGERVRVSGPSSALAPNPRRSRDRSIKDFVDALQYGNQTIEWSAVCFLCLSHIRDGEKSPTSHYCFTSTGHGGSPRWKAAANGVGLDILPLYSAKMPFDPILIASVATHEIGHELGLGDEYSWGRTGNVSAQGGAASFPNLQAKFPPLASGTPTAYDPTKIKWLWPRPIRAGLVVSKPTHLSGRRFKFQLSKIKGGPFAKDDEVLIRQSPMKTSDPLKDMRFKVNTASANSVDATQTGSGSLLNVNNYQANIRYVLICVSTKQQPERKLVAEKIMTHIQQNGPLTGSVCNVTNSMQPAQSPVSLPPNSQFIPQNDSDIIGLYEGGHHLACDMFRPAGRCKMRTGQIITSGGGQISMNTAPFCHVCQYVIVDRIDPLQLVALDKQYELIYPKW